MSDNDFNPMGDDPATQPLTSPPSIPEAKVTSGKKAYQPSLLKALATTFGSTILISAVLKLANDVLTFVSPQLLK